MCDKFSNDEVFNPASIFKSILVNIFLKYHFKNHLFFECKSFNFPENFKVLNIWSNLARNVFLEIIDPPSIFKRHMKTRSSRVNNAHETRLKYVEYAFKARGIRREYAFKTRGIRREYEGNTGLKRSV
jgi:hypothetical protein